MRERKGDIANMAVHLRMSESYLIEYVMGLNTGTEPYGALIDAACKTPVLTDAFDRLVKARANWPNRINT